MSKYRVKNCPAYIHRPLNNHDRVCLLGDKVKPNHKELYVYCQDCTDCKLKQIVELCKEELKGQYSDTWSLVQKISKLLDIEEVE